jgi:hypothetical protein
MAMKEKALYYIPRIFTILAILFMGMFSLDAFEGTTTFGQKMLAFLMHNIGVLILTGILIVAWKRELLGGILFILAAIFGLIFFHSFTGNPGSIVVIGPFFLTGVMFILHHIMFKKTSAKE